MSQFRFIILFAFLFVCLQIQAQSTIFNIPSTDVLQEKSRFIEADFIAHFDKYRNGGFQTYGYRAVYGLRRKLEVGANFFFTRNGVSTPKEFQPNAKWKIYENEKYALAFATGAIVFVPLDKFAGSRRTYAMAYGNASKVFKKTDGLRLTGGVYQIVGATRDFGAKTGAIVGVEKPIFGKISFLGDWYSGKNRLGYSAAGLNYSITNRQFLTVGYNFGNSGRGNNAFSAFYGYTF